jgi:hypothetical protein
MKYIGQGKGKVILKLDWVSCHEDISICNKAPHSEGILGSKGIASCILSHSSRWR